MSPKAAKAAVRAGIRTVGVGVRHDGVQMLIEGGDARYNSVHRPVCFVSCWIRKPTITKEHRPISFVPRPRLRWEQFS